MTKSKLFGRVGRWADVQTKINEAASHGAQINHDKEAGTVVVALGNETLFRGLLKGPDCWLVMYNDQFYPR